MSSGFDNLLVNGFLTCLYVQLIVIGVFNLLNKTIRNSILGAICCLISLSFVYSIFWDDYNKSLIFNVVLGGYKHIFLPSLIYLYFVLIIFKQHSILILQHLLLPFIFHLSYLVLKLGFKEFYSANIEEVIFSINFFIFSLYIFYMYKGIDLFKSMRSLILNKIYNRYKGFFWVLMTFETSLVLTSITPYIFGNKNYELSFSYLSKDFFVILSTFLNSGVLLFAFFESPSLKKFVIVKPIYQSNIFVNNGKSLELYINEVFNLKKEFKNAGFNLAESLHQYEIKADIFKQYLKNTYDYSPIDFINDYRIKEFKNLLMDSENKKFSLMGIASQVGYTSKATFYRNFKKREHITPAEYINSIEEIN